jgi:hypothetical protein
MRIWDRRNLFLLPIWFLLCVLVWASQSKSVFAHAENYLNYTSPMPTSGVSGIPATIESTGHGCAQQSWIDAGGLNYFATWISEQNSGTSVGPITVPYGTPSINLRINQLMLNCHDESFTGGIHINAIRANVKAVSASHGASATGLGNQFGVILASGGGTAGSWAQNSSSPITYTPPGGFITTDTYSITIDFTNVYGRSNGTYACAEGTTVFGFDPPLDQPCTVWREVFNFTVNVTPPPNQPPSGNFKGSCTIDPNNGNAILTVTADTSDPENDWLRVVANVSGGGTSERYGRGSIDMGTFTKAANATYTVSGTVNDAVNTANMSPVNISCPAAVYVQAHVFNAYNRAIGYPVEIRTCALGNRTADANGFLVFYLAAGTGYCISVNNETTFGAVADGERVRPWDISGDPAVDDGYTASCAAHGNDSYLYCPNYASYEYQIAGVHDTTSPIWSTYDRQVDTGIDIALRFLPQVTCRISANGPVEAGVPNNFTVNMWATDTGGTGQPAITSGSASYTSTGAGSGGPAGFGVLNPRGSEVSVLTTTSTLASPNDYTLNGTVSATGDGFPASNTCTSNATASFYPYFKVFGGDVRAGGSYASGGTCAAATSGGVYGFAKPNGTSYSGASSQFGIMALLNVNGVYSSSQRWWPSTNIPPKGATFANLSGGTATRDATYGGGYGASACITNYYGNASTYPTTGNLTSALTQSEENLQISAGDITPGNLTIPFGRHLAVYSSGNVYIDNDIVYNSSVRSSINDIPFFALVVRGNIYIGPNVRRLDGLYIAQPAAGQEATQGRIYTCASGPGVLYAANQLMANCSGNQLVINGGLVAQQVKFLRTIRSLKDSSWPETPNFADGTGTNAAEVINYSPEMYLAPSPLVDPDATIVTSKYDAIFSLPPVY